MRELKFECGAPEKEGLWLRRYYVQTLKPSHKTQGYIMRKVQGHPFANKRGYVAEHRLVIEENLGRFLIPRKELVHHVDGDRSNNVLSNLKLTSPTEHPKGHVGERNDNGQFVTNEPIFQEIKIRLLNKNTKECRPYTLSELISKTYRRGQFEFRGRFTGLKDKNGVEIYESDVIIAFSCEDSKREVIFQEGAFGMVVDEGEAWAEFQAFSKNTNFHWKDSQSKYIEVIGNIYSTPDLIERKG